MPKINKREALKNTTQTREATLSTAKKDDGTLSFIMISRDSGGTRLNWDSYEYYEEVLDITGANTERLNTFFKDHNRGVDNAIGKITETRVDDGELLADVEFDEDGASIKRKYENGTLTDVSVGYRINQYTVKERDGDMDLVTVTDFDIVELSAVGIGFDSGAKKTERDFNSTTGETEMNEEMKKRLAELEAMTKRNAEENKELKDLVAQREAEKVALDKAEMQRLKAENAELTRKNEVEATANAYGASDAIRAKYAEAGTSAQMMKDILDERAAQTPAVPVETDKENTRAETISAIVDGMAIRVGAKLKDPHSDADKYRHSSLVMIANEMLPEDERSLNPNEVAHRSMLSGDFPILLQSVASRVLASEFEQQSATYKAWVTEQDVPDFRTNTDVTSKIGGGRLSRRKENEDFKELSGTENAETWSVEEFGDKFVMTRKMIINDDLGAFTTLIATFGEMASMTANGEAYDILQGKGAYANYKMADGSGVFVATRNNSTSDTLSPEALSAGVEAMGAHKALDGKTPLNIRPKYLIVGKDNEMLAREIIGATNKIGADVNTGEINVHQGAYELIVDAEIDTGAWYLSASRRTVKVGYLAGTNRNPIVKVNDSTLSRTVYEGVFDVGVVVEDYKGLYRGGV